MNHEYVHVHISPEARIERPTHPTWLGLLSDPLQVLCPRPQRDMGLGGCGAH